MNTQYSLPVIHPAFELLKRHSKILHLIAALAILVNALHELQMDDTSRIYSITQLVISADIIILVFFTGNMLEEAPLLNLVFRMIESLVLLGIGLMLLTDGFKWFGLLHFAGAAAYFILLYKESRVINAETLRIRHTGITLPNLVKNMEIRWHEIKTIMPKYHCIIIETLRNKRMEYKLRINLKIDELEQIDDFCQKHLVVR